MTSPAAKKGGRSPRSAPRGRGRPPDHRGDDTRSSIINVAQRLFGESGFKGVTMERLATECDLNVRALYHYFPSKRALFRAATDEAFDRFGREVVDRVFRHAALRARVAGYIDVYRALYATDPQVLSFIGMVLVDAISEEAHAAAPPSGSGAHLEDAGAALRQFLEVLVDDGFARGEVHPDLDREGALMLLGALGMGIGLAALNDTGSFPAMLDALERLTDGTLFAAG